MHQIIRLIAVIALLISATQAQVEKAIVVGSVTDASGLPIVNVLVRIFNEATNASTEVRTDTAGDYALSNLTPGMYTVAAEHSGMSRRVFHGLTLDVGQTARLDISMKPGALEQTIEVTAAAPLLQTENASVGQVISPKPIATLPLNGRNFVQLAILAPGVTGLDYAQTGTLDGGSRADELRPGGTTVEANGARSSSNQGLYDGIDDTELQAYTFIARPTVEGIQEFRVITNNAGAEYGHAGGAVIVLSTKSGTNQLHGSAFEFVRNSSLDAKNFFDRANLPIPPYRLNQFGGSVGGPTVLPHYNGRNRTFFFSDYESELERLSQTQLVTVPTAAMRQGDFSGAAAPRGIFDPLSTRQSGSGYVRDRFPGDLVPAARYDPIAYKLVNLYPLPQTSGLANNYVANPKKVSNLERGDFRLDHQVSSRNSLFGRYSIDQATMVIPDTFNGDIGGSQTSFSGIDDVRGQNAVIADTHTLSSNVILDFRLGFTEFTKFLLATSLTNPVEDGAAGVLENCILDRIVVPYLPVDFTLKIVLGVLGFSRWLSNSSSSASPSTLRSVVWANWEVA